MFKTILIAGLSPRASAPPLCMKIEACLVEGYCFDGSGRGSRFGGCSTRGSSAGSAVVAKPYFAMIQQSTDVCRGTEPLLASMRKCPFQAHASTLRHHQRIAEVLSEGAQSKDPREAFLAPCQPKVAIGMYRLYLFARPPACSADQEQLGQIAHRLRIPKGPQQ